MYCKHVCEYVLFHIRQPHQSLGVLAYNSNEQIPSKTIFFQDCQTNLAFRFTILQTAIFIYCRVKCPFLHHLNGPRFGLRNGPRALAGTG